MNEIQALKEKLQNFRVLFADDEKEVRDGMSIFLKKFFNDVVICSDGIEALQEFQKNNNFDIVITDILMPKMGGIALVNEIKNIKPEMIIVFITALRNSIPCEEQSNICLKKPVTFDTLINILKRIGDRL